MPTHSLRIPADDVVRVVRAEIDTKRGQPEFQANAYRDYLMEEDYNRAASHLSAKSEEYFVTEESVLNVETRPERNYWVLSVVIHKELGFRLIEDESALLGAPLMLDEFEAALRACPGASVSVRLEASTPQAKAHFETWWADLAARHPAQVQSAPRDRVVPLRPEPASERRRHMDNVGQVAKPWTYLVREAVAVFADANALETAVDALEAAGFNRAGISVLGTDHAGDFIHQTYRSVVDIEDDKNAPQAAYVSADSRVEGEAEAVAVPFLIGGLAGAAAVAASGGILAAAIAATILGGAAGAGLGSLLVRAVAHRHAAEIERQLALGGLVLWVNVPNEEAEQRALAALNKAGGRDVHVHTIERQWGPRSRPLSEVQADPFLERDPVR